MSTATPTPPTENAQPKPDYTTEEGRLKLVAETEKVDLESAKTAAETVKLEHDEARTAEKHKLEMEGLRATVAMAKDQRTVTGMVAARELRVEKRLLADNLYYHTYSFNQSVTAGSVNDCISQLTEWTRIAGKEPVTITIIFNSPGGSVIDGMHLWDFLQWVKSQGHTIETVAFGMAASMAGILLQAGDNRVLGKESYLLIHEVSFGTSGKIGEIEDTVLFINKIQNRVLDIFADRSARVLVEREGETKKYPALFRQQRSKFKANWKRKDWWIAVSYTHLTLPTIYSV